MFQIITDTTCDYTLQDIERTGIEVCPLTVLFGEDEVYTSTFELPSEAFYERLTKDDILPSTQAVSPYLFEKSIKKSLDNFDDIICITLGAKLSGTHQSCVLAANNVNSPKVHMVDSDTISGALKLLVDTAVCRRDEGISVTEVIDELNRISPKAKLFTAVDTLDYARHGGRIPKSQVVLGESMGIHPIVEIDSTFEVIAKERGIKGVNHFMMSKLEEHGLNPDYPIQICHGNSLKLATSLEKYLRKEGVKNPIEICLTSPVYASHIGPNSVSLAFISE